MPITPRRLRCVKTKRPDIELLVIDPSAFVENGVAIRRELAAGRPVLAVANGELVYQLIPGNPGDDLDSPVRRHNRRLGWGRRDSVIRFEYKGRELLAYLIRYERRAFDDQFNDFVKHAMESFIFIGERLPA